MLDCQNDEEWRYFLSLLPSNWQILARETGAMKQRLRAFDNSPERLLRCLMIHVGCGLSLKETSVLAMNSDLATPSSVALHKRLKSAKDWFHRLCVELQGSEPLNSLLTSKICMNVVDGSVIKEPGKNGSTWRLNYCLSLKDLSCKQFEIKPTKGKGNGESLKGFEIQSGQYYCADAGYSRASEISYLHDQGAFGLIRVNPKALRLLDAAGQQVDLLEEIKKSLFTSSQAFETQLFVNHPATGKPRIPVRVCVKKKTLEQISNAQKKTRQRASKNGHKLSNRTLEFAKYIILVTTFPDRYSTNEILNQYRLRWQVELVFKRLKSLLKVGKLPKKGSESSLSWLYGKLLISILIEKMARRSRAFSPSEESAQKSQELLERIFFPTAPPASSYHSKFKAA